MVPRRLFEYPGEPGVGAMPPEGPFTPYDIGAPGFGEGDQDSLASWRRPDPSLQSLNNNPAQSQAEVNAGILEITNCC